MALHWISWWWQRFTGVTRRPVRRVARIDRQNRQRSFRPMLEMLEDRTVPVISGISVFTGAVVPGFDSISLPANDDGSSAEISLVSEDSAGPYAFSAPINFFGPSYSSIYVNNNGNLTFNDPQSTYTPFGLTGITGIPIIAPFFADVYTFGASGATSYGFGTIDGHNAFGATWNHVDYYADSTGSKQNTFQVLLIERSDTGVGNFDIEFNYNQIQWETGSASGGTNGLGGSPAHAGFSNGSGEANTFYEISGSGVAGAFLDSNVSTGLIYSSNCGVNGRFIFNARSGIVATSDLSATPATITASEGIAFSGVVASFTDSDGPDSLENYSATITWGDGHTSTGTIAADDNGGFTVSGTNTYAEQGTYGVRVHIVDVDNAINTADANFDVTVTDAELLTSPSDLSGDWPQSFTQQIVATFTDPGGAETLENYAATIDWGDDSTPTTATISYCGTLGSSTGVFTVRGDHAYLHAGHYTVTTTITHETAPAAIVTSTADIAKATPIISATDDSTTYTGEPLAYPDTNVTVSGANGLDRSGGTLSYTYTNLSSGLTTSTAPSMTGSYSVVVTFTPTDATDFQAVSTTEIVTWTIVPAPQVLVETGNGVVSTKTFAPGENGTIVTQDKSANAEVFQTGPDDGGPPVQVSIQRYATNPVAGISDDVAQTGGQTVIDSSKGSTLEKATYDLQVLGARPGMTVVARFAIPSSTVLPTLLYVVPGVSPKQYAVVPASMFKIVDGYYVVTFGDDPATHPNIFDLTETVFTITDATSVATVWNAIFAATAAAPNASTSDDELGALLNTQSSTDVSGMINVIAPTSGARLGVQQAGGGEQAEHQQERQEWMRTLENILREIQRIFGTQVQMMMDSVIISLQTSLNVPEMGTASPAGSQEVSAMENALPVNTALSSLSGEDPFEFDSSEAQTTDGVPTDAMLLPECPHRRATFARDDRLLSCASLAATPFLPWLVLNSPEDLDRKQKKNHLGN